MSHLKAESTWPFSKVARYSSGIMATVCKCQWCHWKKGNCSSKPMIILILNKVPLCCWWCPYTPIKLEVKIIAMALSYLSYTTLLKPQNSFANARKSSKRNGNNEA